METLKSLKKIKVFDIDEFDGKKAVIEDVVLMPVEQRDFGDGMKEVRQIKIITSNLSKKGDEEFRATEYVPLKFDVKSKEWGIPLGKQSKAVKVLSYFKANDFTELIGKECMVVKRVNGDKSFLGIHNG